MVYICLILLDISFNLLFNSIKLFNDLASGADLFLLFNKNTNNKITTTKILTTI